jgi:hypothetical protein
MALNSMFQNVMYHIQIVFIVRRSNYKMIQVMSLESLARTCVFAETPPRITPLQHHAMDRIVFRRPAAAIDSINKILAG